MKMQCEAIIFDLDGVLVDSHAIVERHWERWAASLGLPIDPILSAHHGRPTIETVREFAPYLDAVAEARSKEWDEADDTEGLTAYSGAAELLKMIPDDRWTIATSGTRRTATARLRHVQLRIPDGMITADDVKRGKPDPEPYLAAAARLSVSPEKCMVVEDAPSGVRAARLAGAQVIAVASTTDAASLSEADAVAAAISELRVEVTDAGLTVWVD